MHARAPAPSRSLPTWTRHLANFGPLLFVSLAAFAIAKTEPVDGTPQLLRDAYGVVVALNVLVIAMTSWSSILGALVRLLKYPGLSAEGPIMAAPTRRARTAVLLATHEEDAARIFATARAIADDAARKPLGRLDVFVLSDSHSAAAIAAEESMHALAARCAPDGPRLFYRRRAVNTGRKAGNVAEFVRRWGAAYDFMLVLDADSLMTGACIGRLIGAMEANPRAGLIQAMCYPVGRTTGFARLQQFDARLIGPLFQKGVAFWQGPCGNFWGHNAIVRIAAFAANCGLPVLPGRPPLGGEIISHDTVEAAFMLRDGHDIWMLPDGPDGRPDGSWEETPTNLLDHLERDRRWLRGNMQHVRVLAASGLKTASFYHLGRGLAHFLYAPLILAWLGLYALLDRKGSVDALTLLVLALLLTPRLVGLLAMLGGDSQLAGFGGQRMLCASVLLDQLLSSLLFPTLFVSHLVGLAGLFFGGETRWDAQGRSERGLRWRDTTQRLGPALLIALVLLLMLARRAPLPVAFFATGLAAGIPLAVLSSRRWLEARLFSTPEDTSPHPLRIARAAIEAKLRAGESLDRGANAAPLPAEDGLAMPPQAIRRCRKTFL